MRLRILATAVLACLAVAGAVATAQSARQTPKPEAVSPLPQSAGPEPFKPPSAPQTAQQLREKAARELLARVRLTLPRTVCPMQTVPADPELDAAIRKSPPPDTNFRIRTIPPPCATK
jgi:hypothetical protein